MARRPTFNFDSIVSGTRRTAWARHWPRKIVAVALCVAALVIAATRAGPSTTQTSSHLTAAPTPRPDITAGLRQDQRAVSVSVLSAPMQLIRPGDTVDLLAAAIEDLSASIDSAESRPQHNPAAQVVADAVQVLAIEGDSTACGTSGNKPDGVEQGLNAGIGADRVSIVVAASMAQALSITAFASGAVLATVHPRK